MKNAAKCDTWCELQNPANHRVFERKLRPKPSGRGHVCLGVTQPSPPTPSPRGGGRGADVGLPCAARTRLAQKQSPRRRSPRLSVVGRPSDTAVGERLPNGTPRPPSVPNGTLRPRPQVRREHPLSLSISISGGKETYQDSPSNGERTGKSPA
ncbi:hypothetical protein MANES_S030952v8 [Manihot esculenta]|uniref:Uncharacterized protein n=1 Tax=Manihot esculenta TaxID=3983 RepID=A0ACB7FW45_MANES|nr:hypothetical protein MANES_S030952v8 [Manihot esculenta]